jgi:hypothetical protein
MKFKAVYDFLMQLSQSSREQGGGEGRKDSEVTKTPKQSLQQFELQLILLIKVGGRVSKHYTNLGITDCLFYLVQ